MNSKLKNTELPPHQLVREFFQLPHAEEVFSVLDAGCHRGRNANYTASLGHNVIGLNIDADELQHVRSSFPNLSYIAGDVLHLPFRRQFDVVLLNEVLQDIPPNERILAIRGIQRATVVGGFNVVSAYTGDKDNAVERFELYDAYRREGWHIVECSADFQMVHPGSNELASKANIIARKEF